MRHLSKWLLLYIPKLLHACPFFCLLGFTWHLECSGLLNQCANDIIATLLGIDSDILIPKKKKAIRNSWVHLVQYTKPLCHICASENPTSGYVQRTNQCLCACSYVCHSAAMFGWKASDWTFFFLQELRVPVLLQHVDIIWAQILCHYRLIYFNDAQCHIYGTLSTVHIEIHSPECETAV